MRGSVWLALVLVLVGAAVGVRFWFTSTPGKNVTLLDPAPFNRELAQATSRHDEWTGYPLAVARRFAASMCDCPERTVEGQPPGADRVFHVTVADAETPHKMRGHIYRLEIVSSGGQMKVLKATREWLPWSKDSAKDASPDASHESPADSASP